jgi:signal transduction histidine kinase/HAMP domain-containing protein
MVQSFYPMRTIRGKIFLAFCAMSVLTGAVGVYGIFATTVANRIVVDIYDRPLMAINFARSASSIFAQMGNQLLQARMTGDIATMRTKLKNLSSNFFDDLGIAEQRSMSPGALAAAHKVRGLAQDWLAAAVEAAMDERRIASTPGVKLVALSEEIMDEFDRLIELTAEDGFHQREQSLRELGRIREINLTCSLLAVLLAGIATFVLDRRIQRPLAKAVAAADRVAAGDFEAKIPDESHDEIGSLMRSMRHMQASIREMMRREEAARRSAQARLVDAIEGSHEAMVLVGSDGKIVILNSQVGQFLPHSSEQLTPGAPFVEALRDVVPVGSLTGGSGVGDPAEVLATEGEVQLRPDLWLRVSRSVTQEGGFFLFWSDISDIKEREARLLEAKQEAEAASRAKSYFLATMSHELRTPLNAIIGFSEIIANELFGPVGEPRYQEYGGLVVKSGRHLLNVINSVLDYAKSEAGRAELRCEPVDLTEIVADCLRMVDDQSRRAEIEMRRVLPDAPLVITGDDQKLRQLLLNLVSNAIKFTNAGGSVEVRLAAAADGRPVLSVSDTGIGMKTEDIPTALAPFGQIDSRLARKYEGTGLGLPLAKAFAEMHGAEFVVRSALGVGTTITIVFPQEADGSAAVSAADEPASVLISERRRRTRPYLVINELVQTEIANRVCPEHEVQDHQAGDGAEGNAEAARGEEVRHGLGALQDDHDQRQDDHQMADRVDFAKIEDRRDEHAQQPCRRRPCHEAAGDQEIGEEEFDETSEVHVGFWVRAHRDLWMRPDHGHRPDPVSPFFERGPEQRSGDGGDQDRAGQRLQALEAQRVDRQIGGDTKKDRVVEQVEDTVLRKRDAVQGEYPGSGDPSRAPRQGARRQRKL